MRTESTILPAAIEGEIFLSLKSVTNKLLFVLELAYDEHREEFESLVDMRRGKLVLFAKNEDAIKKSAKDPRPKIVPNTPFWVPTKTSTASKQETLTKVLTRLGYEKAVVDLVVSKIV